MSVEPPVSPSSRSAQGSADVLHRARQGDPAAIAVLLNQQIKTRGLAAQVTRQDQSLHIDLQSSQVPDQVDWVVYLRRGMANLQPAGIQWVRISGRVAGAISVAWTHTFDLATIVTPAQPITDRSPLGTATDRDSTRTTDESGDRPETLMSSVQNASVSPSALDATELSKSDTLLQSRARQGDRQALESWLNQALANKQIQVTAHPSGNCLRIMLEAVISPDQKIATALIQQLLQRLQPAGIQTVQLYGQQTGQDIPDWSEEFALTATQSENQVNFQLATLHSSNPTPPAGKSTVQAASPIADSLGQGLLRSGTIASPSTAPRPTAAKSLPAHKTFSQSGLQHFSPVGHVGLRYAGKDLRQLSLANQDLMGADFRGANLSGVSLRRSRLAGADFSQANLQGADLSDTSIGGANFTAAQASNANFSQTRTTWQSDWLLLASRHVPTWAWVVCGLLFLISFGLLGPSTFASDYVLACIALAISAPASIIFFWDESPEWGKRLLWGSLIGSSTLALLSFLRFPGFTLLKTLVILLIFNSALLAARRRQWILLGSWLGFAMGLTAASLWYWVAVSPTSILNNPTMVTMCWYHAQLAILGTLLGRMTGAIVPLRYTSFQQANLENATFAQAILRNADFSGANLSQVDFTQTDLLEAKLPDQFSA